MRVAAKKKSDSIQALGVGWLAGWQRPENEESSYLTKTTVTGKEQKNRE